MMTKDEFLKQLEFLLQDVADEEREEALSYYRNYFEDAGLENEAKALEELGSPEKIAATIKGAMNAQFDEGIEYGDHGVYNSQYEKNDEIIEAKVVDEKENVKEDRWQGSDKRNKILLIAIIIGIICLVLPIGGGLGGLLAGFFVVCFALACVGWLGTLALYVGCIMCIVEAVQLCSVSLPVALLFFAGACLCIALSYLTSIIGLGILKVIPKVIRGIVDVVRKLVGKVGQ